LQNYDTASYAEASRLAIQAPRRPTRRR